MSNGKTMAEKLLGRAAGRDVTAGEIVVCRPDFAMGTDGSIPMAIDYLQEMNDVAAGVAAPAQLVFALDHYGIRSGKNALLLQDKARQFAKQQGIRLFDAGDGIGHQLLIEEGYAAPGRLIVGADSHSTSYGALNCFGTGIGSSDLAGLMFTEQLWMEIPQTIRIELRGRLRSRVSAKDVALFLAGQIGADGANYRALEFCGEGLAGLDMDDRIVLSNMSVELGAKAGIFPYDATLNSFLETTSASGFEAVYSDADAQYVQHLIVELDMLTPQIALPHRVDNVCNLQDVEPISVGMVYLGTCTGGRLRDYEEALEVIRDAGRISGDVELVVTPASRRINEVLASRGLLDEFVRYGARIEAPGCGACCGTCGTVGAGQRVMSSANRNFKGRMGDSSAEIYLASSYSCAAAAVAGVIGIQQGAKE